MRGQGREGKGPGERRKEQERRVRERREKGLQQGMKMKRQERAEGVKQEVLPVAPHPFHSIFPSVKVTSHIYTQSSHSHFPPAKEN